AQAKRYERISAIIDHGNGNSYVVDVFNVEGGKVQDYVFHGPQALMNNDEKWLPAAVKLYDLANVRGISENGRLTWMLDEKVEFSAWCIREPGERAFTGDGWGQRDPFNADRGKTLPYIV